LDGGLKHNDWSGVSDALESPWNSLAVGFFPCQGMLYSVATLDRGKTGSRISTLGG